MSIAYAENPFCLVVAGDNEEITSFADLAGRSCANALNSTAGDLARKAGAELSDASLTAAMDLIVSGRGDATVNNVAAVGGTRRRGMNVKVPLSGPGRAVDHPVRSGLPEGRRHPDRESQQFLRR